MPQSGDVSFYVIGVAGEKAGVVIGRLLPQMPGIIVRAEKESEQRVAQTVASYKEMWSDVQEMGLSDLTKGSSSSVMPAIVYVGGATPSVMKRIQDQVGRAACMMTLALSDASANAFESVGITTSSVSSASPKATTIVRAIYDLVDDATQ